MALSLVVQPSALLPSDAGMRLTRERGGGTLDGLHWSDGDWIVLYKILITQGCDKLEALGPERVLGNRQTELSECFAWPKVKRPIF